VALARGQFMEARNSWEGAVGSLLQELAKSTDGKITGSRCWPASPRGLGSSLRRLVIAFRSTGMDIQIEDHPRKDGVHFTIEKVGFQWSQRSPSSPEGGEGEHGECSEVKNVSFSNGHGGRVLYHPAMIDAAISACDGLTLEARRFLRDLHPDDQHEILTDPETARAFAESLAARLASSASGCIRKR
jgi:hypothetical protein